MANNIFVIKCNGVSICVSPISIDEDQTKFDYICNVLLENTSNGNGTYDVSIINEDYIQGMPVGKWKIKRARISYDWYRTWTYLTMEDENGIETKEIITDFQSGSVRGLNIESLTQTIISKAQEVARDYPNAKVCDAVMALNASKRDLGIPYLKSRLKEVLTKSDFEYLDFIEFFTSKISNHLKVYKDALELLDEEGDERNKIMRKQISAECKNVIAQLIEVLNK